MSDLLDARGPGNQRRINDMATEFFYPLWGSSYQILNPNALLEGEAFMTLHCLSARILEF